MSEAPWPQPFSSSDGIPDEDWNAAVAQWRAGQGGSDPQAPGALDQVYLGPFDPKGADLATLIGQAQMPPDQWQAARAQQLAANDADDAGVDAAAEASAAAPFTEDRLKAFQQLMASPSEEGRRNEVYLDSLGKPTVGIGHLVQPQDHLRVGQTISDPQVDAFFRRDATEALQKAQDQAAQAGISDPSFVNRLAAVNFQLGGNWPATFPKTWGKILAGDYAGAADEVARSKWYRQAPRRVEAFQAALRALAAPGS